MEQCNVCSQTAHMLANEHALQFCEVDVRRRYKAYSASAIVSVNSLLSK